MFYSLKYPYANFVSAIFFGLYINCRINTFKEKTLIIYLIMSRPQIITIDDIKYYNANDLKKFDPVYFFGCSRTIRTIIKKKNINIANIAFGNDNVRLGWRLSSDQSKPPSKAKLLLVERWVLENVRRAK